MNRRLFLFLLFVTISCSAIFFNILPYGIAFTHTPDDFLYSGKLFLSADTDIPTYYAKMQTGFEGNILYTNLFTTEKPNPPVPLHLFYTTLGAFSRLIGSDVVSVFFIARVIAGFAFLFAVFIFCLRVAQTREHFVTSFLLATFGSGLGWFFSLTEIDRSDLLDIFIPAFMPLTRFFLAPHISIAGALFIVALYGVLRYQQSTRKRFLVLIASVLLIENLILPYYAIGLYGTIGVFIIAAARVRMLPFYQIKELCLAILASLPTFLIIAWVPLSNQLWNMTQAEAVFRSPSLIGLIIGFGLLVVFSISEIALRLKQKFLFRDLGSLLLTCWICAPFLFAFFTFLPQRVRLFETPLIVPFAIFSSAFLFRAGKRLFSILVPLIRIPILVICSIVVVIFFTLSSFVTLQRFPSLLELQKTASVLYLSPDMLRASEWIKKNSVAHDALLASAPVGNMLPYLTSRYVYIGHWSETVRVFDKIRVMQDFYNGTLAESKVKELFLINRIRFVMDTPHERAIGTHGFVRYASYLSKEFEQGNVSVYRVLPL